MPKRIDGSSPLTRGTLHRRSKCQEQSRFIPAYAGNSKNCGGGLPQQTVHPRLRGELGGTNIPCSAICGSSPLTRGTLFWDFIEEVDERFIPAYAGNSTLWASVPMPLVGSSPLTRGTQYVTNKSRKSSRFIPAYAGNSLKMVTTLH